KLYKAPETLEVEEEKIKESVHDKIKESLHDKMIIDKEPELYSMSEEDFEDKDGDKDKTNFKAHSANGPLSSSRKAKYNDDLNKDIFVEETSQEVAQSMEEYISTAEIVKDTAGGCEEIIELKDIQNIKNVTDKKILKESENRKKKDKVQSSTSFLGEEEISDEDNTLDRMDAQTSDKEENEEEISDEDNTLDRMDAQTSDKEENEEEISDEDNTLDRMDAKTSDKEENEEHVQDGEDFDVTEDIESREPDNEAESSHVGEPLLTPEGLQQLLKKLSFPFLNQLAVNPLTAGHHLQLMTLSAMRAALAQEGKSKIPANLEIKRLWRRHKNKEAAAKSRKRRNDQILKLQTEADELENNNSSLHQEMIFLQQQRDELELMLGSHKGHCNLNKVVTPSHTTKSENTSSESKSTNISFKLSNVGASTSNTETVNVSVSADPASELQYKDDIKSHSYSVNMETKQSHNIVESSSVEDFIFELRNKL
ncbi:unnamed protein product, partial [Meganyctiphanes norvegica]